ncbi:MAG: hypothetical protein ACRED5_13010 [Propylenella sp.]
MGHIRLKRLPASRKWRDVVALLADGAPVEDVAGASADAAEAALQHARDDPVLAHSLWLLTQIPLAARAPNFEETARSLGLEISSAPSLMEVVGAYSEAVSRATAGLAGRTDLGEMAQSAAAESLATVAGADLPGLFSATPADVRLALGKLAAPNRFARLARDFFARLTQRHLDYYLSRTLSNQVGPGHSLATTADHSAFNSALEQHCREASRIVEEFAGGWFSKTNYQGGITPEKARGFAFVALGKISAELQRREAA